MTNVVLPDDSCIVNSDCQQGWLCNSNNECEFPRGKVLLKRVVFTGFENGVNGDSTTTVLFGEKTRHAPDGVTCEFTANPLDHFQESSPGRVSYDDRQSLGSCWEVNGITITASYQVFFDFIFFQFPLNAKLSEGSSVAVTGPDSDYSWSDVKVI